MLNEKIIQLKKRFVEYADLLEDVLQKVYSGLCLREDHLLREVIDIDEPMVNDMEIEIDDFCLGIIAQFQPKAKSLRTIMMISKINNDFERIGDQAVNVAESSLYLLSHESFLMLVDFSTVLNQIIRMYGDSVQSFIQEDADLARKVMEQDEIVDCFNRDVYHKLKGEMQEDPKLVSPALQVIRIARNFERMADHITNIAEDVVYVVEGKVCKRKA
ncbi:phosphate transport system regulatory protein PhoU [PVC group bacterium (ex Bugula neritina AB1)]|nr:phosphate transport system regulatory protein PhoU [PVC group bacterium (ex Bugula neritina AB1)]